MGPERLLSAAEHQALELIESRLERDDSRLADRLTHAFEYRRPGDRLVAWSRRRSRALALAAAVVLVSAAAFPAGGPAFAAIVSASAVACACLTAAATCAYQQVVRRHRLAQL